MLTTSPACAARHSNNRIARSSTRAVSPLREICPAAGLTHHAPTRNLVVSDCSMPRLTPSNAGVGNCINALDEVVGVPRWLVARQELYNLFVQKLLVGRTAARARS